MNSPVSILFKHKIKAKKKLGQNFMIPGSIEKSIIKFASLTSQDTVLELGPGLGVLTISAAKLAKKVLAIEKDHRLLKILNSHIRTSKIKNIELIYGDILTINLKKILNKKSILIGNLPYNISSQILMKIIEYKNIFKKAIITLQKEMGDRLCSKPSCKTYGRLSVIFQYHTKIKTILKINPSNFFPKPKVDSCVLEIVFKNKSQNIVKNEDFFLSIIKAAFSKRRKTLKNSLSRSDLNIDSNICNKILHNSKIDPERRAETLSVNEFVTLTNHFYEFKRKTFLKNI